ncbi:DNA replication ATP-dependent helicase Dna2 [Dysgonomonas sp. PFB1-18]|uniref:AAA domain-containing protein n=1 Tax=unclassified Dysgonomonas TaxID=2630389 RepID=UPI0024732DC8|nr:MULTISPECIES: AAA domain-containing protein [unclassified Dysgonomonas]MDH6307799.1 DNA replication ATP-dependent helicase Dna2 [Dysgonomonas sp. PF1-14]MDH6337717.1 DNA replication ATP-dependent helicase Dna2 [Dysgonomonas sp. PF1-16]MDH6378941.1 DNA replication ATP-dependent helicase Dna2 [Dysgonomonas sp. PFB1-18]MDH6396576.1 DNA replication ATP-dependent helicase Dna2 [Dysgonomonas sp. PF1-23]
MSDKPLIVLSDYSLEIQQIDQSDLSLRNKYIRLKQILERSCKDITASESLQFPSLFSRLVFISQKYELPKSLEWRLQNIRIKAAFLLRSEKHLISPYQYEQAKETLEKFFLVINGNTIELSDNAEKENTTPLSLDKIRVQVLDIDRENEIIICQSDSLTDETLRVKYNIEHVNDLFNDTISRLWTGAQLNLIDVKEDGEGYYIPKIVVLEPDYLIDASAIAECFQSYGNSHLHYFRRKFEPNANTHYILLGNLANYFLDELIYAEDAATVTFEDTFMKSFRSMPFEYASCKEIQNNSDFKEFMAKAESQFNNIKRVVLNDMPANGFKAADCILEPSFFSEKYGFQGRLDLLQLAEDRTGTDRIIELKSGKPPYPREDVTKIAPNHETQTAVYRLMIQSVFGKDARHIYPTILYSAAENDGENIRFAAFYQQLEKEIINTRNLIVATEHDLYIGDGGTVEDTFRKLFDMNNYGRVPQFFTDKLNELKKILDGASTVEKAYFYRYISFISRELYLQKTGDEGYDSSMSVSALWNTTFEERRDGLDLIAGLEIEGIDDSGRDMIIRFRREIQPDCVNFREGEICILYPKEQEDDSVLTNQILKGTVVKISSTEVILRFRYKQRNRNFFTKYRYWAVEHDKLDHSYNAMFKSLFAFLASPIEKKELLLGIRQPDSSYNEVHTGEYSQELKQEVIINKALSAKDYFLIVGPPGTGKTSIFARKLIERLHAEPNTNILVIAYTNRAVDELCASVCAAFGEDEAACSKYIRIGTELSCGEPYRHRLLQNISHKAKNRKELLTEIDNTRIFIGTLASVTGKSELFDLKQFDTAIIDEASQILEPQIIGLLPQCDRFIMIGDHKQLSTITLQDENKSKVTDSELNAIGLYDCRESLFERLYHICQKNEWTHAYDTLTYHGRMHYDIAELVNNSFYDNRLKTATERQQIPLSLPNYDADDKYQSVVANTRIGFVPVRVSDYSNSSDKINLAEADTVVSLATALLEVYRANNLDFDSQKTLGIITPYRNQIALIKRKLEETGIAELRDIMVDTVERYQGSQRDVIIFSFCFNKPYQLRFFSNMNRENTVDRKLNVALTRAREQLFLVGNDHILSQNSIYKKILEAIG